MKISRDLTAAFVTPLVLALLDAAEGYGYDLIKRVRDSSAGAMQWSEGMLYPVLHRLEKRGLVSSSWKTAESGRRRRYYSITQAGRVELSRQSQEWRVVLHTLGRHGIGHPQEGESRG